MDIKAMQQFDMTVCHFLNLPFYHKMTLFQAWVKNGTEEAIGIITNSADPDLMVFQKQLVERYRIFL